MIFGCPYYEIFMNKTTNTTKSSGSRFDNIINKRWYDFLVSLFSLIALLISGALLWLTIKEISIPKWANLVISSVGIIFSIIVLILGFLVSPVDFIDDFAKYCNVCSNSLSKIKKSCEIYTIQTPINFEKGDKEYRAFQSYLETTAKVLIKQRKSNHLINHYKRLVVIYNNSDKTKDKNNLLDFVEKVFKNSNQVNDFGNIEILVARHEAIDKSPYTNMDILIIGKRDLNIAIPKYQHNKFHWGLSIHIQKTSSLRGYNLKVYELKEVFDEAWRAAKRYNSNFFISFRDIKDQLITEKKENEFKKVVTDRIDDIFNIISRNSK